MERSFTIRNHVRKVRVQRGLTQQALADAIGVTRQTIGLIEVERYNPTLALAFRMARILEVRVDELFSLEEMAAGQ